MYKVEKNIPLPRKKERVYPFNQMKKGDSFFIPTKTKKEQLSKRRSAANSAKRLRMKITTSAVDGGLRVWRIV